MPIDEIAEGVLKVFGRIIGRVFIEVIFEFFCYWVGRIFLKTISFGKYPKDHFENELDSVCSIVGIIIVVSVIVLVTYLINK